MKSPQAYLEHINLSVNSIDSTLEFLKTALPEFEVRGEGIYHGHKWVHVGTDDSYLAINENTADKGHGQKLNHIGFVVEDVKAVSQRLISAGYERSYPKTVHPHRIREYFEDEDKNEFEFVEYLSQDPKERNHYSDLN